nr:hypothetical protein [Ktedonospora formicarum]
MNEKDDLPGILFDKVVNHKSRSSDGFYDSPHTFLIELALACPVPVTLAFALHLAVGGNAERDQIGDEQQHQFAPCEVATDQRLTVINQPQERADHQCSLQ